MPNSDSHTDKSQAAKAEHAAQTKPAMNSNKKIMLIAAGIMALTFLCGCALVTVLLLSSSADDISPRVGATPTTKVKPSLEASPTATPSLTPTATIQPTSAGGNSGGGTVRRSPTPTPNTGKPSPTVSTSKPTPTIGSTDPKPTATPKV